MNWFTKELAQHYNINDNYWSLICCASIDWASLKQQMLSLSSSLTPVYMMRLISPGKTSEEKLLNLNSQAVLQSVLSCSWIPVEVSNIYERKPQQVGNMINLCFCTYLLLLVHEFPNKTLITKGLLVYEYCTSLMIKSNSGDSSNPCTFKFYLHKAVNLQDLQLEHFL